MNSLKIMRRAFQQLEENAANEPYKLEKAMTRLNIGSDMVLMPRTDFINLYAEKICKQLKMKDDINSDIIKERDELIKIVKDLNRQICNLAHQNYILNEQIKNK